MQMVLFSGWQGKLQALWGHQRVVLYGMNFMVASHLDNQATQDCNVASLSEWEVVFGKQLANTWWLFFIVLSQGNSFKFRH